MNTDFRVSCGYFEHPKIQKLGRILGSDGILSHLRLLRFVAVNRPSGELHSMDCLDIALASGFGGDEAVFLAALLDTHLLDEGADGALTVHGWADHNDYATTAPQRKAKAQSAAAARWGKPEAPPVAQKSPAGAQNAQTDAKNAQLSIEHCSEHEEAMLETDCSNAPTYKHTSKPSYVPTSEAYEKATTPRVASSSHPPASDASDCPEAVVVARSLRDLGVSDGVAAELIRTKGCEYVQKQIEWWPFRLREKEASGKPVRDPGAFLAKAIQDGYAVPGTYSQARKTQAEQTRRAERAQTDQERLQAEKLAAEADRDQIAQAFARLSPEQRQEISEETTREFVRLYPVHAKPQQAMLLENPERMPPGPRKLWLGIRNALLAVMEVEKLKGRE